MNKSKSNPIWSKIQRKNLIDIFVEPVWDFEILWEGLFLWA